MAEEKRIGRQTPTINHVITYEQSDGKEAIDLYNSCKREAQPWQELMCFDILSKNEDGLYIHTKFGYSVPRRNGKGEVLTQRELFALFKGERTLHTAHRTTTSSSASKRLEKLLKDKGYTEVLRFKKDEVYEKSYIYAKQYGLERITLLDTGGTVDFRTRTSSGGLGEGFDLLIIDEAQEYTDDQESTLKYTVSDSKNPQIIMCGTPPTNVSKGTVFLKYRNAVLSGETNNSGWAEWSVESMHDVNDVDAWYECNPAMGFQLNERKVGDEIGTDDIDFNIQRLGLWLQYNQKSAISEREWNECIVSNKPNLKGKVHVGIKYGKDNVNVALSLACKTDKGKVYCEVLDCREIKEGNMWIINSLMNIDYKSIIIDGVNQQSILIKELQENKIKKYKTMKVSEIIEANSMFTQAIPEKKLSHNNQPSLSRVVTNCDKRAIGSNGGFGYIANSEEDEIALMDACVLSVWSCLNEKEKAQKRKIVY